VKNQFSFLILAIAVTSTILGGCNSNSTSSLPVSTSTSLSNPAAPSSPVAASPSPSSHSLPILAGELGIQVSVDLRANDGPVEDQFGGTCSAFGTAAAMDNYIHSQGTNKNVSEEYLWSLYDQYSIDDAVQAATQNYVEEESDWPVDGRALASVKGSSSFKITQSTDLQYDLNAALQAINLGHALVMAIQVPASMDNCDDMVDPTSAYTSGQHVIEAAGYQLDDSVAGGGYFIIKNSWGPQCGMSGYQYYPFALCQRSDLYCYFIQLDGIAQKTN